MTVINKFILTVIQFTFTLLMMLIFVVLRQRLFIECKYNYGVLSKAIQNFKSNPKIIYVFFMKFCFVLFILKVLVIHENTIILFFFFFRKWCIYLNLLPSSSSPNIYNFVIDINTSITMNYQIESVKVLKFRFFSHPFSFPIHRNHISYTFSQNSSKN